MAENKTQKNTLSVTAYLEAITDESRRNDCMQLADMMEKATGQKPFMWGEAIVGFGEYHYASPSGRSGEWFVCGFSSRKAEISIYLMSGLNIHQENLAKLGKHKLGKGCLYVKILADIDLKLFTKMLKDTVKKIKSAK